MSEPAYFAGIEFTTGSFTSVTSRIERAAWDSTLVDYFREPVQGRGLFDMGNDDGIFTPRSNSNLQPGKAMLLNGRDGALYLPFPFTATTDVGAVSSHITPPNSDGLSILMCLTLPTWPSSQLLLAKDGGLTQDTILIPTAGNATREFVFGTQTGNKGFQIMLRTQAGLISRLQIPVPVNSMVAGATFWVHARWHNNSSQPFQSITLANSFDPRTRLGVWATDVNCSANGVAGVLASYPGSEPSLTIGRTSPPSSLITANSGLRIHYASIATASLGAPYYEFDPNTDNPANSGDITLAAKVGNPWTIGNSGPLTGGIRYPLFFGRIDDISYTMQLGNRKTLIEASDDWERVSRLKYNTPILVNYNVASVFTLLMSQSNVCSFTADVFTDAVGFAWYQDKSANEALQELVKIGSFCLYIDGAGTYSFRNRNFQLFAESSDQSSTYFELRNRVGQDSIINQIKLKTVPRVVVSQTTTLAFIPSALTLPASSAINFWLTYQDPLEPSEATPVASIVSQVSSTDYFAAVNTDGTGTNITSALLINFTSFGASAVATITNGGGTAGFLTRFQVRGFPIRRLADYAVQIDVATSQARYGIRPTLFDTQLFQSPLLLDSLASYISGAYKDPKEEVSLTLVNEFPNVLKSKLGNNASFIEAFTGYSNTLRIHRMSHEINMVSGLQHKATYELKSFDASPFLILDDASRGKLDDARVLAI